MPEGSGLPSLPQASVVPRQCARIRETVASRGSLACELARPRPRTWMTTVSTINGQGSFACPTPCRIGGHLTSSRSA